MPQSTKQKHNTTFWRSPKGDIGIVLKKDDEPRVMQKRERIYNILSRQIAKQECIVRKKFMLNHPVVRLLEKNLKKIDVNGIFVNDKGFNKVKKFQGIAMRASTEPRATLLEEIGSLSVKQNIGLKQKLAHGSINNTFYVYSVCDTLYTTIYALK